MQPGFRRILSFFLSAVLCLSLIPTLLSGCGETQAVSETAASVSEESLRENGIVVPVFSFEAPGEYSIHTEAQTAYLFGDYRQIADYADGTAEKSRPEAVVLTWSVNRESRKFIRNYHVLISESPDFAEPIDIMTREERVSVYNLKIGTRYYWTVTAYTSEESYTSQTQEFFVENVPPRNLSVDGVTNVRDLGGWETEDGGRVRQGLIYRCGKMSENYSGKDRITKAGKKTMLDDLKMRSEIDLRSASEGSKGMESGNLTESPLGGAVNYFLTPISYHADIDPEAEHIREIFEILADEENYPVCFHCSIGTDRTGKLAFLINALLGVREEYLYTDYLFSNFGKIGSSRAVSDISSTYVQTVQRCPGDTLSEKTYYYLEQLGIPAEHLDALITIMKEPAA